MLLASQWYSQADACPGHIYRQKCMDLCWLWTCVLYELLWNIHTYMPALQSNFVHLFDLSTIVNGFGIGKCEYYGQEYSFCVNILDIINNKNWHEWNEWVFVFVRSLYERGCMLWMSRYLCVFLWRQNGSDT